MSASAVKAATAATLRVAGIGRDGKSRQNNGKNYQQFARHMTFLPIPASSGIRKLLKNMSMQVTNLSLFAEINLIPSQVPRQVSDSRRAASRQ